jgi:hypothetical protein
MLVLKLCMKIHKADVFKWIETIFSIYLTRIKTKKACLQRHAFGLSIYMRIILTLQISLHLFFRLLLRPIC